MDQTCVLHLVTVASYGSVHIVMTGKIYQLLGSPPALPYITWSFQVKILEQEYELYLCMEKLTFWHAENVLASKHLILLTSPKNCKDPSLWWLILIWVLVTMVFGHQIIRKHAQGLWKHKKLKRKKISLLINCHFRQWH